MATRCFEKDNILKCTICLERFRKPKYLPCLHTFCLSCLNTYILSSFRDKTTPPTSFSCPICRAEVKPPQESSSIEEWAELLPPNHTIYSLMGNPEASEQPNDNNCDHCERDDEIVKANFRCLECRENLCETCRKYHKRQKPFVKHRLVLINDMKPEDIEAADVEEPCTEHKGEMIKVYCVDHGKMCCVICLSVNHRKCENVKTLDEMAKNMKKNESVQQLKNKISDIGCRTEALLVQKRDNIDNIERQHQNVLSEISKIVQEAQVKLDQFNEQFKKKSSSVHKEHTTNLLETKERLENFQKFLTYCETTLEMVTKFGSPKQCFITLERIRRHIDIQGKDLEEFLKDDQDIAYKLVLDKHLTCLNTSMSSIAELHLQKTPNNKLLAFTTEDISDGVRDLQCQLRSADIFNLESDKVWDVCTAGRITSGLFLRDGNLICVDHDINNVYVYDTRGKLLTSYLLDFIPWGISQSPDGRLYISEIGGTNRISVFTTTGFYLNEENRITMKCSARALKITEENVLMQQDTKPESIHSMSLDGQNDREICECNENSGIAVGTTGGESRFYYCEAKSVICKALDGTEVFRHDLQDIVNPRGVALDATDNVYVCGTSSNNIYVISRDGSSSRVFMSNTEISKPYAIGFDNIGIKFYVTSLDKSLTVYDLSLPSDNHQ